MRSILTFIASCTAFAALSGCGDGGAHDAPIERDPVVAQVLGGQLMVDPDLAERNEANAALTVRHNHGLPPTFFPREAVIKAREQAAEILADIDIEENLPDAEAVGEIFPDALRFSAAKRVALLKDSKDCGEGLEYSASWAARTGKALPLYPMSATVEAAGLKSARCDVVSVSFIAPVPTEEIIAFYQALADKSGHTVELLEQGDMRMLRGSKSGSDFILLVPEGAQETTRADLVISRS